MVKAGMAHFYERYKSTRPDNAEMYETLEDTAIALLEEGGLRVDLAVNGRYAVEMVNQNPYDLVLMDMQMPEMDGIDATLIVNN